MARVIWPSRWGLNLSVLRRITAEIATLGLPRYLGAWSNDGPAAATPAADATATRRSCTGPT